MKKGLTKTKRQKMITSSFQKISWMQRVNHFGWEKKS